MSENYSNNFDESKYNSSFDTLWRMNKLLEAINVIQTQNTFEGLNIWHRYLNCLHKELWPYLNDEEKKGILLLRVPHVPDTRLNKPGSIPSPIIADRLDAWEMRLRVLHQRKGFAIIKSEKNKVMIMDGGEFDD